ncbi:YecA family protein [Edwardsiella ictaluri]|uniref:UPF0149 protein MAY91_04065 n=1 Tax=Edwardsiella ictaluri TaxID=67780 RepID=A0ABY8GIW0_EDWIC|nr:YecA family protein [Edwardsiella ictaluri]ELV7527652.1 YecA family protein [Edwardsiella ictaluri]KMQ79091.1 hypothetical protein ABY58_04620 [Edwardsiella ictaluri]KOO55824.1 hypothetical protein ACS33_04940 [Edwardsiella ictaluri]WFN97267.1 YecA family protein [Edwardsiella ictaluri]
MSTENSPTDYATLTQVLQQQGVALTAAEMHGLLSGLLCGGNRDDSWLTLVHDLTNEGMAFSQHLSQPLQVLYGQTRSALEGGEFAFQLLLPGEDDASVFARADALAGWVNHFLLGLGMMQTKLGQVKGDVGESIDDLRNIAQLGYDEDEDQETLAHSLEEVAEYVRMAAMLCHGEFSCRGGPASDTPRLH